MVSLFVYFLPCTPTRGPCCWTTSAPAYNVHPDLRWGACLCPRGQCNQGCDEHPHRTNMLQIKGGAPYHWKDSNTVAMLSLLLLPLSQSLSPLLSSSHVADAITIAVIVVAGCCHCNQDNKFLTVFVMSHVFLQPQTGDHRGRLHHQTEGDGLGEPKAWEIAPKLAWRPALLWVLWRVGRGVGRGLGYDGEPQCSTPYSQVPSFFMGACIHAHISCKRHHSIKFARGEGSQDDKQICVAVHPFNFCIEQSLVSWLLYLILLNELSLTFLFDFRFNLKTGRREMSETTVCFQLMGPTFGSQWATQSLFGATSSRKVVYITRWGCASWWETFAGGVGLMPWVSGMTCQFCRDSLVSMLEPGELCETDRGYQGAAPAYVKCPGVVEADPNTAQIQQRVWRQETVNKWFKNWAILSTVYHHDLLEHQTVLGAIVILTQLSFAANPLFQVAH